MGSDPPRQEGQRNTRRGQKPQVFGRVAPCSDYDPEPDPDYVVICPVGVVDTSVNTLQRV